jgi:hypothetical protein
MRAIVGRSVASTSIEIQPSKHQFVSSGQLRGRVEQGKVVQRGDDCIHRKTGL